MNYQTFDEHGALSSDYLRARGYCCENGCRNCPYGYRKPDRPKQVREDAERLPVRQDPIDRSP